MASPYSIDALLSTYLETMASSGDAEGDGGLSPAELAYGLDDMVSSFIEENGLSIEDHAAIQRDVINTLAHELTDMQRDPFSAPDGPDIAVDSTGDANSADVLAALDHHFQEIYDAHVIAHDSYPNLNAPG